MRVHTIGFTRRSAEEFFSLLREAGITRLLDVRLRNTSQLAGFTKRDDLAFFLRELLGCDYEHRPELAPTPELFRGWRRQGMAWDEFAAEFRTLMAARAVERHLDPAVFGDGTVLLCSEPDADRCHRSLVVEYLAEAWGEDLEAHHL